MLSRPFKQRKSVDLPQPDGPNMTTTSPLLIERSMPFKIFLSANFFCNCEISNTALDMLLSYLFSTAR